MGQTLQIEDYSVVLPESTMDLIGIHKRSHEALFRLGEIELKKALAEARHTPTEVVRMLRIRFWDEWNRAEGGVMLIQNIHREICPRQTWEVHVRDPYAMAWILCPVGHYITKCDERINTLMGNLSDVSHINPVDETGRINLPLAKLQFQMLMYFDQRKNGAIVQRTETKNLNVSANLSSPASEKPVIDVERVTKLMEEMSHEEIQAKLREARARNALPDLSVREAKKA